MADALRKKARIKPLRIYFYLYCFVATKFYTSHAR